jgi:hypothetical protein
MKTQLRIKLRQLLFSPSFVTLVIGVVVVLALGGPSAHAQTTTDTTTTPAGTVDSSITVAVKGSVTDPNGAIAVTGNVIINCRRVVDTTSQVTPALVLLDFDFSQVKGTSGTKTTLKTYVTGDNHSSEIRPFQAGDTVIVTVPYYDSTRDQLTARTFLATATLNFDITTGKLTSGSMSVGNNVVTSAAVGSFTASTPQ